MHLLILTAAHLLGQGLAVAAPAASYGAARALLMEHVSVVELRQGDSALLIVPEYQARVMTSTAQGDEGVGFGWLNGPVIRQGVLAPESAKGKLQDKIHVFGGEERFWLGPEGGQYGLFFGPGADFDFETWKTPAPIDTRPFDLVHTDGARASFQSRFRLQNRAGTNFDLQVRRNIRLLGTAELAQQLGAELPGGLRLVAYETINTVTNTGEGAWTPESGLLSIWLLGMYHPSPGTVMAIPYRQGEGLGPEVKSDYFGTIGPERLRVEDGVIYFKGDGQSRGKVGLSPQRSLGVAGSYSPELKALTLVRYPRPAEVLPYVNSAWEIQEEPYAGDAINAYNDGSPAPGAPPLGPFYELESSSPALALAPGESATHRQITIHGIGTEEALDPLALQQLGVSISQISHAFARKPGVPTP